MKLFVRIICLPSAWPELSRRAAAFLRDLNVDSGTQKQPKPYWKDARFCLFEQSFSADRDLEAVSQNCSRLFGSAERTVLTQNENEIEIGAFASIPEMLADCDKAFIYVYGVSA